MAKQSLVLDQGEILRIIVIRSKRKAPDVASALGLNDPTYLSKLYQKDMIPNYVIQNACAELGYDPSIFEVKDAAELENRLSALEGRVRILEKEKDHLNTEVALLSARLEDCEREKDVLQAKRN